MSWSVTEHITLNIIKISTLTAQFDRFPDVEGPLLAWLEDVKDAQWSGPQDVRNRYPSASFIADNRIVFNIKGNHYRLIVAVFYPAKYVYIKFFGTHSDYDTVDAAVVDEFRGQ